MKLFLDTNIILDILLEREGYEDSVELFRLQEEGKITLAVSILTIANVAFVYRKTVGQNAVIPNLKYLSVLAEVLPMGGDTLQQSLYLTGNDFEDILQYNCAVQGDCDAIVTRNEKDFIIREGLKPLGVYIPVYSPSGFLNAFAF